MPKLIPKKKVAKKAVKVTAKHSARGAAAKVRRNPVRATSLIGLGVAIGAVGGWIAGRKGRRKPEYPPAG